MGATSKIEWTNGTWSPIRAKVKPDAAKIAEAKGYTSLIEIAEKMSGRVGPHCERISAGCGDGTGGGCYAEANNHRCLPSNGTGLPFDRRSRDLIEPFVDEKILMQPLRWKAPRRIFVENQSDLFGEWVTDEAIDRVFAVMALCPQHTWQILTKRPERMLAYCNRVAEQHREYKSAGEFDWGAAGAVSSVSQTGSGQTYHTWPLPNVWAGVSCEDQKTADERIPLLLQAPAAVRFVSYEPALGPVDFWWLDLGRACYDNTGLCGCGKRHVGAYGGLDWIIAGSESGPGARPADVEWFRSAKNQCVNASTAFFYKQFAVRGHKIPTPELDGQKWMQFPEVRNAAS